MKIDETELRAGLLELFRSLSEQGKREVIAAIKAQIQRDPEKTSRSS